MNRSVRNGLAVAGMAGGLFLLGQAAAQADDVTQTNAAPVTQTDQGGPGSSSADVDQSNHASVDSTATVRNVGVGVSLSNNVGENVVNAGPATDGASTAPTVKKEEPKKEEPKPAPTTTTVHVSFPTTISNTVGINSTISNSGNATVAAPSIHQSNSAPITQSSTEGDKGKDHREGDKPRNNGLQLNGPGMGGPGGNTADVDQHNSADVDSTAKVSNVGVGVDITNNVGGNTVNCYGAEHSSVVCDVSFPTTITNTVNITSIICGSGNATIGTLPSFVCNLNAAPAAPAPAQQAKAAVSPAAKVAAVKHAATTSASSGKTLAFTGAETTGPLTLGLIALGAGGVLTLAGRRRTATAAV